MDILKYSKNIPNFRGVFMLDNLPKQVQNKECGIVNLDKSIGPGTHWVAYFKNNLKSEYFDSFGNLKPPKEIIKYLGNVINYNYLRYQEYDSIICGHLCIDFLNYINKKKTSINKTYL